MFLTKIKIAVALVLAVCVTGIGAGLITYQALADNAAEESGKGVAAGAASGRVPLESVYSTSGQKELKHMTAAFRHKEDGDRDYIEPYGWNLEQINRLSQLGCSNVFLVRGKDIAGAVKSTRWLYMGTGSGDVPVFADEESKAAPLWAVAFFGVSGSNPPAWLVQSVERKGKTVRISYVTRTAATHDQHRYFLWVPIGTLEAGTYTFELFDVEKKEVTLLRRCRVTEK
jgi:hypothetical protein